MERLLRLDFVEINLGWREVLLALVFFIAAYMLFELLRLRWLRRRREGQKPVMTSVMEPVLAAEDSEFEPESQLSAPRDSVLSQASVRQAQESFMRGVEYEMAQMRDEIDSMRGEFAALRAQVVQESAKLRASQVVSPIYNDAMRMAVAGHDAGLIAERCGISRAEADLVVALVNNPEQRG